MSDVFLSYAREDAVTARHLAEHLREEGWSVFWDRQIPVGKTWENTIEEQLSRASCVVVLWSSASIGSDWVRAEAAAAVDRGVLVPALIDRTSPPVRFRIIQSADLLGWQGSRDHLGLTNLIAAVRAALGTTGKPDTTKSMGAVRRDSSRTRKTDSSRGDRNGRGSRSVVGPHGRYDERHDRPQPRVQFRPRRLLHFQKPLST